MRSIGGAGFVIIGFLLLYLAITGKMDCFFTFISCVFGTAPSGTSTASNTSNTSNNVLSQLGTITRQVPTFINFSNN